MTNLNDSDRAAETSPGTDDAAAGPTPGLGWGDYCVPALIFLFCGVISYVSTTFDEALPLIVGDSMQPRVFPIFLMAVVAVLNIGLIAQVLSKPASRRDWEPYQTWASAVLFGVFYFLATFVDIMIGLMVTMFALSIIWGERRVWVAAVLAIVTTSMIFFSFGLVLEVRFPRGLFTDWYYG